MRNQKNQKFQRDKYSDSRKVMTVLIAVFGISECIVLGILKEQELRRMIVLAVLGILYSVIFLTGMEMYRFQDNRFYEKAVNYRLVALWYGVFCMMAVLMGFLPEFARPVLLLGIGMTVVTNPFFGLVTGIFHATVLALCGQENIYVLLCDVLLVTCGCMTVFFFEKVKRARWKILFLFLYTFADVFLFTYLQSGYLSKNMLIYGLCNSVFCSFGAEALYQCISSNIHYSEKRSLRRIIKENFGLVKDVRNYSAADYKHAKRVSEIAGNCAVLIDADPDVAAAGGFYYRLGRMVGKPYVENGVGLAKSNKFPMEVIRILEEYNGEERLPSTLESAIVHIVDSVVGKFDVMDKKTLSSSWNQDILVYQTLNEHSAAGLYDKSGFSMNMFLKIRDYLIKEAKMF